MNAQRREGRFGEGLTDAGTACRALVIDDSPILALQLQQLLSALGIGSCCRSVSEYANLALQPEIVFVELLMLQHNGFSVMRTLRERFACPLVLVSGTGRSSDVHWGRQTGASTVLTRPLMFDDVKQCLHELGLLTS